MRRLSGPIIIKSKNFSPIIDYYVYNSEFNTNTSELLGNFNDEFFVYVSGNSKLLNNAENLKIAIDTAIWAYQTLRLRPSFWEDKKLLTKRILHTCNIRLFHILKKNHKCDQSEISISTGIIGQSKSWFGCIGINKVFFFQNGFMVKEFGKSEEAKSSIFLGQNRYGLTFKYLSRRFNDNDVISMMSQKTSKINRGAIFKQISLINANNISAQIKPFENVLSQAIGNLGSFCIITKYHPIETEVRIQGLV
jgi:hypothetical protein